MIEFSCECEKKLHRAPVEAIEISDGAINKLPELLKDYKRIFIVADENTYLAAGEAAERILKSAGKFGGVYVLNNGILPDATTVGNILIHLNNPLADADIFSFSPMPDYILAVGSGTINDCCRLVSYRLGLPYGILGTAPSMDGYASAGSPTLFDNSKATIKCTTPRHIIADLNILANAPYDMLLSGIGDMLGKYTGLIDWELAVMKCGEYYCKKTASDVREATDKCAYNARLLSSRDHSVIKNIMEGFMVTGLGMAFTGNSRPASGSEHIIAHAWELSDVEAGKKANLHGLEVAEASIAVGAMYTKLYSETDDSEVKELIEKYLPLFRKTEKICRELSFPLPDDNREFIKNGIIRALNLRDRYTVLFYLRDNGLFEEYAEYAAEYTANWFLS